MGNASDEMSSSSEEPYIFTTVRYDTFLLRSVENTKASCNRPCPFYMLEHHWTRLQVAKWGTALYSQDRPRSNAGGPSHLLQGLLNAVKRWQIANPNDKAESLRVKLRNYTDGRITTEIWPIARISLHTLFPLSFDIPQNAPEAWPHRVVLDTQPTPPDEATMFKTNDRSSYGRARASAGILSLAAAKEVLLYTPESEVLDGSISTPYFFRNGRWVTPAASSGGLQGTTRRWALERGFCVEEPVRIDSLENGETVWLSNGVKGYYPATYVTRNGPFDNPAQAACDFAARQIC